MKGIWDAFPVTEGHLLITPHRHVAAWSDLHGSERDAVMAALDDARTLIHERYGPDGFNVGFNEGVAAGQTVAHFHLHVIPRRHGDMDDPRGGVRHVIPERGNYLDPTTQPSSDAATPDGHLLRSAPHSRAIIAGGEDELLQHLIPHIDRASRVDAAVSFVMDSGVRLIQPHLQDLLDRGGVLRIVTGDYLDVTDPAALRRLLDLSGEAKLAVFEAHATVFHPKAWIFHYPDGAGVALVGSSNLSESALRRGVEWNFRIVTANQQGGWRDALNAFEALVARPEVKPLSHPWIDSYELRRRTDIGERLEIAEVGPEPPLAAPMPNIIQQRALAALVDTREVGYRAGLVVLATGLGKTWLGAFDADRPEFRRVLFVAHREEILNQAFQTFRAVRPNDRFGRYSGEAKDRDADVLFASVQTLGRADHLRHFSPDAFDYIVIDEFHHAAARTYRSLIDHFRPKFLLGLTATPDRSDGGDLLSLCQENLVFECGLNEGIETALLCPFHYFGVPDAVEYSNIPWRSSGFDETALTNALTTQTRARNALEQLKRHGGRRVLAFCCSQRHADFMADFFNAAGRRSVAVHSGPTSAPRATSLQALESGEIETLFAVDMFNEGVDVPNIDTILMLRPTASAIIWIQQFGRGLRRSPDKDHLDVIDYIGNHRTFLSSARVLLNCGPGDRDLLLSLEKAREGTLSLPPGCEVTYELEAFDLLRKLLRRTSRGDAVEAYFVDFKERLGTRPTAVEMYHAGFDPMASGHGGWFEFVRSQGDLTVDEAVVLDGHRGILDELSRTAMTRSYKMILLQAMQSLGAFPGSIPLEELSIRFRDIARRNPMIAADIGAPLDDDLAVQNSVTANPIAAWTGRRGPNGAPLFAFEDAIFKTTFSVEPTLRLAFNEMVQELVDWRLAKYLDRPTSGGDGSGVTSPDQFPGDPSPGPGSAPVATWREYMREEIPPLFGLKFKSGNWNQGFVVDGRHVFLLVTLEKANLQTGRDYDDQFTSAEHFRWHSQNRTAQDSAHGRIISQKDGDFEIHLFVRAAKLRGNKGAPFYYCGDVDFESWTGDAPITVNWRLREPAPEHLRRLLKVP